MTAYGEVFSAIDDYTFAGPGTYGYPQRSWYVFHREALPADLIPQLPRADITPQLDDRFAQLAAWYQADGHPEVSCLILERVAREAPLSVSGRLFQAQCASSQP
jgi:hypothetical protein